MCDPVGPTSRVSSGDGAACFAVTHCHRHVAPQSSSQVHVGSPWRHGRVSGPQWVLQRRGAVLRTIDTHEQVQPLRPRRQRAGVVCVVIIRGAEQPMGKAVVFGRHSGGLQLMPPLHLQGNMRMFQSVTHVVSLVTCTVMGGACSSTLLPACVSSHAVGRGPSPLRALLSSDGACREHLADPRPGRRTIVEEVEAGDICAISGLPDIKIGETICEFGDAVALPTIKVGAGAATSRIAATVPCRLPAALAPPAELARGPGCLYFAESPQ
jgi:hypothetical protein